MLDYNLICLDSAVWGLEAEFARGCNDVLVVTIHDKYRYFVEGLYFSLAFSHIVSLCHKIDLRYFLFVSWLDS